MPWVLLTIWCHF